MTDLQEQLPAARKTIDTPAGTLTLVPATPDDLRIIAYFWPMEVIGLLDRPGCFGLVFQRGDEEVHGVKVQFPELREKDARIMHGFGRIAIATALRYYMEHTHFGLMIPTVYYKQKGDGMVETGYALFVAPDPEAQVTAKADGGLFDERFGAGASPMIRDMIRAIGSGAAEVHAPERVFFGLDIRPRLAMGGIAPYFVITGPRILVVKDPLQEEDLVWEYLVRAGYSELPYAPMELSGLTGPPSEDVQHV